MIVKDNDKKHAFKEEIEVNLSLSNTKPNNNATNNDNKKERKSGRLSKWFEKGKSLRLSRWFISNQKADTWDENRLNKFNCTFPSSLPSN